MQPSHTLVVTALGSSDEVFGGSGDDFIRRQAGSQTFVGGRGNDTLS
jgi:Ca2+-binding RTX toxin-like protein